MEANSSPTIKSVNQATAGVKSGKTMSARQTERILKKAELQLRKLQEENVRRGEMKRIAAERMVCCNRWGRGSGKGPGFLAIYEELHGTVE